MGLSLRYYLFPEDGQPVRLSKAFVEGLTRGTELAPQYAGTRQRILHVVLDNEEGSATAITDARGSYFVFDETGSIEVGLQDSIRDALDLAYEKPTPKDDVVVPIERQRRRKKLEASRWSPTKEELELVSADIWPRVAKDRLKTEGAKARPAPKLTNDGNVALDEIRSVIWKIDWGMHDLTEPALAGLAHRLKLMADEEPTTAPILLGAAQMALDRKQILARKKINKGVWYAFVEVMEWDYTRHSGEVLKTYHQKCNSRKDAVAAARSMLARYADQFDANRTVEAGIESDLEWNAASRMSEDQSAQA